MIKAKTGNWQYENPQRARSNNSMLLIRSETTKEQFLSLMQSVKEYGEPGFIWAEDTETLYNPCCEISLYAYDEFGRSGWQVCNLCEINGKKIKSEEDFAIAAKGASALGTLQAGYDKFEYLGEVSENIIRKEALLGVSITGMMDNPDIIFNPEIQRRMAKLIVKTNEEMAAKIGINPAARCTCVKPSGCQTPNTLVSTQNGILRLGEIGDISGDQWQEGYNKVNTDIGKDSSYKFFVNGYSQTKKILLSSGIVLECTPNHKYRVISRDGQYIWRAAEDIGVGDVIPYRLGEYDGGEYQKLHSIFFSWNKNTPFYNRHNISQPGMLDEDLAWLMGLYFGDGSNHCKGIRIHGNSDDVTDLQKAARIIKKKFDIDANISNDNRRGKGVSLYANSVQIVAWLKANGLCKNKSRDLVFPLAIRISPKTVIKAFIDGYAAADGCDKSMRGRSYCTTSPQFAQDLVVILRSIGIDCKMRLTPPTATSKGRNMRYWVQHRKGKNGNINKNRKWIREAWLALEKNSLDDFSADKVVQVVDSMAVTCDIEVSDSATYLANSYVSHNTTSCILGTASGVHPHHAKRYFRRVQGNALEPVLQYFKVHNGHAVEKSVWAANDTDEIITFTVEVPDGAKTKNQLSACELLEYIKLTQQNWVAAGKVKERCVKDWLTHNVSNTISVRANEWDEVANYIYNNRKWFAGISLLSESGDLDYPQAPMCRVRTAKEILQEYGDGALMASGLVVDGLHAYGDLWKACDSVLGVTDIGEAPSNGEFQNWFAKSDWIRRVKQFADRYCENDIKRTTYLLKEVNNYKLYLDLQRNYKDVPYEELIEEENNTKPMELLACHGGACLII
jgi:intein/homing endonuclease